MLLALLDRMRFPLQVYRKRGRGAQRLTIDNQRGRSKLVEGRFSHSTCGSNDVSGSPGRRLFRSPFVLLGTIGVVLLVVGAIVAGIWAAKTLTAQDHLPKWMTDQQALMDAVDHDNALADQDSLKPKARGEYGSFLLVGPGNVSQSPIPERCDVQTSYGIGRGGLPLAEVLASPLAIPELAKDPDSLMAGACDGVVISVNGGGDWDMPDEYGFEESVGVGVLLISHLPFRAEWDTAADRTELGEIDGYPALIERPISGQIMNFPREALILFAEPKDDRPGIILSASHSSVERASEAVISSLEKRIAEMGLPPNPYN
jgi:hypothetical protein